MRLLAATKNPGKLRELRAIFSRYGWTVDAYPEYLDPEEGEESYAANAALKARTLYQQLRAAGIRSAAIADDSGFEVAALNGRPGIRSARYGPSNASWAARRAALLAEFERSGSTDRRARFVCALHLVDANGREYASLGTTDGRLAERERGDGGFSYDCIFEFGTANRTFAEIDGEEKNVVSHRARAAALLVEAKALALGTATDGEAPGVSGGNTAPPGRSSAW